MKNRNKRKSVKMGLFPKVLVLRLIILAAGALAVPFGFWFLDSKWSGIYQQIHKAEQDFTVLENKFLGEEKLWKENLETEKLDRAINHHGLGMTRPTPSQTVRISAKGHLIQGQPSITFLKRAGALTSVAEAQ